MNNFTKYLMEILNNYIIIDTENNRELVKYNNCNNDENNLSRLENVNSENLESIDSTSIEETLPNLNNVEINKKYLKQYESDPGLNDQTKNINIKPLGEAGEISINELINKFVNYDFSFIISSLSLSIQPVKLIPAGLLYRIIIKVLITTVDPEVKLSDYPNKVEFELAQIKRLRNIRFFMLTIGPAITYGLLHFTEFSVLEAVNINVIKPSPDNKSTIVESISILALLINNYKNNDNNKFNGFKLILRIVGFIILFFCLFDFDTILGYLMFIKFKWLIIINLIVIFGIILYNVISLILYKLFINNKIKLPTNFPKFLYNWLTEINKFSKFENKDYFVKVSIREIIVYSISFLFIFYFFIL